jgi:hypothetical protein
MFRGSYNSKSGCRAPFPESFFTRGILGHVFLQQTAPQGLKCATASIHGIQLGKVGMWAAVVTPLDLMGRDTGILLCSCFPFCHTNTAMISNRSAAI